MKSYQSEFVPAPYFPVLELNTDIYVEYRKYGPVKTLLFDTFHAVNASGKVRFLKLVFLFLTLDWKRPATLVGDIF